jgi:hypothetical protein
MKLITHINPEGVKSNINPFDHGSSVHTDIMKTQGLKQALDQYRFDAAFGGARRDEGKVTRQRENFFFSYRTPISGTQKTSGPNFGTCIMPKSINPRVFGYFRFPIGPN